MIHLRAAILLTAATLSSPVPAQQSNLLSDTGSGGNFHARTSPFAIPYSIPGNLQERRVTSIEIKVEFHADRQGSGTITFDESQLRFTDFGDPVVVGEEKTSSSAIVLKQITIDNPPGESRRVYELAFPDGAFQRRLYLVISPLPAFPHRLLISLDGAPPVVEGAFGSPGGIPSLHLAQVLPLEDVAGAEIAAEPWARSSISLVSADLRIVLERVQTRLVYFQLRGDLSGKGFLEYDRNARTFNVFGDATSSTLIGFFPRPLTFREIKQTDPAKRNRRLFELVPDKGGGFGHEPEGRYFLVLSPTAAGPDRLIIRDDDDVHRILPLFDPSRRRFLRLQPKLAKASRQEQEAIAAIHRIVGTDFSVIVEADQVVRLTVRKDVDRALEHIGALPHLEDLEVGHSDITDAGLRHLRDMSSLRVIRLRNCPGVTDAGLSELAGLMNLRFVDLYTELKTEDGAPATQITDAGLQHLARLSELRYLSLTGAGITDRGIEQLMGLKKLEQLHLYWTSTSLAGLVKLSAALPDLTIHGLATTVRDGVMTLSRRSLEELQQLQKLTELKGLRLSSFESSDALLEQLSGFANLRVLSVRVKREHSLKHLAGLVDLEELDLSGPGLPGPGLAHLRNLPRLETLRLTRHRQNPSSTRITDGGLRPLKDFASLRELDLSDIRDLTNDDLSHLRGLASLEKLRLAGRGITDEGLETIGQLSGLRTLDLGSTGITGAGLKHLAGLSNLEALHLDCTATGDVGLYHLAGLTNLEDLRISYAKITDSGLLHLKGLTSLHTLWLQFNHISDAGLEHLSSLINLKELRLNNNGVITDEGVRHLAGLSQLERLFLNGSSISDVGLEELRGLTRLKTLYVVRSRVTDAGEKRLKEAIPDLEIRR